MSKWYTPEDEMPPVGERVDMVIGLPFGFKMHTTGYFTEKRMDDTCRCERISRTKVEILPMNEKDVFIYYRPLLMKCVRSVVRSLEKLYHVKISSWVDFKHNIVMVVEDGDIKTGCAYSKYTLGGMWDSERPVRSIKEITDYFRSVLKDQILETKIQKGVALWAK